MWNLLTVTWRSVHCKNQMLNIFTNHKIQILKIKGRDITHIFCILQTWLRIVIGLVDTNQTAIANSSPYHFTSYKCCTLEFVSSDLDHVLWRYHVHILLVTNPDRDDNTGFKRIYGHRGIRFIYNVIFRVKMREIVWKTEGWLVLLSFSPWYQIKYSAKISCLNNLRINLSLSPPK
jgi:hypothetical protein